MPFGIRRGARRSPSRGLLAGSATAVLALVASFALADGFTERSASAQPLRSGASPFDARRAFADLRFQVALGPRRAGSPANRRLGDWLRTRLPGGSFEAVPGGLRNVVYTLPGTRPAVVIGAHYDTDDIRGFVGANDGASGTATLLELLRDLDRSRPHKGPELRFVFFDGEEKPAGSNDFLRDGIRGSRAYVRAHHREIGAMILLDFVGNRGLQLPREATSSALLWTDLRTAARRAGELATFPDRVSESVLDDHTPFLNAGIPAIDLIDFGYRYYDQVTDTLDKVTPASLNATGRTVLELLTRGPLPARVFHSR
jgi:glutaminyl-peptide cyclotransferase